MSDFLQGGPVVESGDILDSICSSATPLPATSNLQGTKVKYDTPSMVPILSLSPSFGSMFDLFYIVGSGLGQYQSRFKTDFNQSIPNHLNIKNLQYRKP